MKFTQKLPLILLFSTLLASGLVQASTGLSCTTDDDCTSRYYCSDEECVHEDPTFTEPLDLIGYLFVFLFAVLATAAGVGGGVFFVPIYMLLLGFEPKSAVALSNITICPSLIIRFLLVYRRRHPSKNSPLIDYDIALLFSPCIILGTVFGVLLNRILPTLAILVLIAVVLSISAKKTFQKGLNLFRREKAGIVDHPDRQKDHRQLVGNHPNNVADNNSIDIELSEPHEELPEIETKKKSKSPECSGEDEPEITDDKSDGQGKTSSDGQSISRQRSTGGISPKKAQKQKSSQNLEVLEKIDAELAKNVPWAKFLIIFIGVVVLFSLTVLSGTRGSDSLVGVERCSAPYWFVRFAFIPFALLLTWYNKAKLEGEYREKEQAGFIFDENDLKYDSKTTFMLARIGVITGTVASILGVGGAIITGPILLSLNFHPEATASTATFMAMFTSLSTTLQYFMMGRIPVGYALRTVPLAILGCLIGVKGLGAYIRRSGHSSYLVFLLAGSTVIAATLIIFSGLLNVFEQLSDGENILAFHPVC